MSISKFTNQNENIPFEIDKIILFSSIYAENQKEAKIDYWNLNLNQYTDIAIYLENNHNEDGYLLSNTIKSLAIENISYSSFALGSQHLFYKNINAFGSYISPNGDEKTITFTAISNDDTINYELPQIYMGADNPITLGFVNKNIKENVQIPISEEKLVYDGSILKRAGITLSPITGNIKFDIKITNLLNQEFINTMYIPISLKEDSSENSIYEGYILQEIPSSSKFYRIN